MPHRPAQGPCAYACTASRGSVPCRDQQRSRRPGSGSLRRGAGASRYALWGVAGTGNRADARWTAQSRSPCRPHHPRSRNLGHAASIRARQPWFVVERGGLAGDFERVCHGDRVLCHSVLHRLDAAAFRGEALRPRLAPWAPLASSLPPLRNSASLADSRAVSTAWQGVHSVRRLSRPQEPPPSATGLM